MLKINLLPTHILERRRVRGALRILVLLVLELIALAAFVFLHLNQQVAKARDDYKVAKADADAVRDMEAQVEQVTAEAGPYQARVQWYRDSQKLPDRWARLLEDIN